MKKITAVEIREQAARLARLNRNKVILETPENEISEMLAACIDAHAMELAYNTIKYLWVCNPSVESYRDAMQSFTHAPSGVTGRYAVTGFNFNASGVEMAQDCYATAYAAYMEMINKQEGRCAWSGTIRNESDTIRTIDCNEQSKTYLDFVRVVKSYTHTPNVPYHVNDFVTLNAPDVRRAVSKAIRDMLRAGSSRRGNWKIDSIEKYADDESGAYEIVSNRDEIAAIIDGSAVDSYLSDVVNGGILTEREKDVLRLIPYYDTAYIARKLDCTPRNVQKIRDHITAKLTDACFYDYLKFMQGRDDYDRAYTFRDWCASEMRYNGR